VFLVFLTSVTAAHAACDDRQEVSAILPAMHEGSVTAVACANVGEDGGSVRVDVLADGKLAKTLLTKYAPSAYVLALDTAIRFDNGTSQGLGVATGEGRDGNGMHYWKISSNGSLAVDLGDAPELKPDRFMHGAFSALVSTMGAYQSYRYFYRIERDRLRLVRAVGFKVANFGISRATLMNVTGESKFIKIRSTALSLKSGYVPKRRNSVLVESVKAGVNCRLGRKPYGRREMDRDNYPALAGGQVTSRHYAKEGGSEMRGVVNQRERQEGSQRLLKIVSTDMSGCGRVRPIPAISHGCKFS
jgi:hypothetical protein